MEPFSRWERLAAEQHGVLSRDQALALGLTRRAIDRRVSTGRWTPLHRGVYLVLPLSRSWHQLLAAAVLHGSPSAVASHRAAARLWRLDGVETAPLEVSVSTGGRIDGVVVHRRRAADQPKVVQIEGIATTGVERTLLDLAAVAPFRVASLAMDDALRRGLTSLPSLRRHLPKPGRAGRGAFRRLIQERDDLDAEAESRLETMLLNLLRRAALPAPITQYDLVVDGVVEARLDFAYPSRRVGIEADGYRWHSGVERWHQDVRRENRVRLLGWTLLRFTWRDVRDHPDVVIRQVRAALERAQEGSPR